MLKYNYSYLHAYIYIYIYINPPPKTIERERGLEKGQSFFFKLEFHDVIHTLRGFILSGSSYIYIFHLNVSRQKFQHYHLGQCRFLRDQHQYVTPVVIQDPIKRKMNVIKKFSSSCLHDIVFFFYSLKSHFLLFVCLCWFSFGISLCKSFFIQLVFDSSVINIVACFKPFVLSYIFKAYCFEFSILTFWNHSWSISIFFFLFELPHLFHIHVSVLSKSSLNCFIEWVLWSGMTNCLLRSARTVSQLYTDLYI